MTDAPIIDFSDVPGIEPIPPNTYQAEIVHAEAGVSKAGAPKINMRWKVLSGEYADRIVFHDLSFHENALWRTKQVLLALGYDASFSGEVDPEELLGLTADIDVTIRQSEGTNPSTNEPYDPQNSVQRVRPSSTTVEDMVKGGRRKK